MSFRKDKSMATRLRSLLILTSVCAVSACGGYCLHKAMICREMAKHDLVGSATSALSVLIPLEVSEKVNPGSSRALISRMIDTMISVQLLECDELALSPADAKLVEECWILIEKSEGRKRGMRGISPKIPIKGPE
jgi:hypothetical protein